MAMDSYAIAAESELIPGMKPGNFRLVVWEKDRSTRRLGDLVFATIGEGWRGLEGAAATPGLAFYLFVYRDKSNKAIEKWRDWRRDEALAQWED